MNGISLIMATIGRVDDVRRFVECLGAQTSRNFELIVVDQNPDDRLVPVLKKVTAMGVALLHIRQTEPNQCLARNLGLANASMDVVAFPDDDCWYEPDTLELVTQRMAQHDVPAGLVARWAEQDPSGKPARRLELAKWRAFREVNASMITQFYRRRELQLVDGFDPALGLHSWFGAGEEIDLMFRMLARGATVVYLPQALVHHAFSSGPGTGSWQVVCRSARSRARGTGALYAKHHLSTYVILRGFIAPAVSPAFRLQGWKAVAKGFATAIGRIEGYSRWLGRSRTSPRERFDTSNPQRKDSS